MTLIITLILNKAILDFVAAVLQTHLVDYNQLFFCDASKAK